MPPTSALIDCRIKQVQSILVPNIYLVMGLEEEKEEHKEESHLTQHLFIFTYKILDDAS